ncbi:MAG TPA: hypothetical protein VFJ30_12355 [Phycisphaerae bacterium]|nr:hypothetical protein [Phycisphaerae bacterium]
MRIFLAGIIQGSLVEPAIHCQGWRDAVRDVLARHYPGADVYCHYESHPNSIAYELPEILATLEDGNAKAAASDVVVCWLPSASMGTGLEMYLAQQAGAVVLAVTPMAANWVVRAYSDRILPDLDALDAFCASGELDELLRAKGRSE